MTVETTATEVNFAGNGVTTSFPFTFKCFAKEDLVVTTTDSDDVVTTLTLDSNYSVALNADQNTDPGGTVTYPISGSALASGNTLSIYLAMDFEQTLDLPGVGGGLSPTAVENAFDRGVMLTKQVKAHADRAIVIPRADDGVPAELPTAANRAGMYLAFDATGDPIAASGTGADDGLRTDLAASSGSSTLGFIADATGAVERTAEEKLNETKSVQDFGAHPLATAAANAVAIQDAFDWLRDTGGVLTFPHGLEYQVNVALTLQRSSSSHAKRWVIEGNGSVVKSTVTSGALLTVGATSFSYFVEDGGIVIRDLSIHGLETAVGGSSGVDPTYDQTGLYLYIAGNVLLENIQALKSKTGIRTHACFPLKAIGCSVRGSWVGVHLDEASNLQDWDGIATPNCRYGILVKSTTTSFDSGKINNITFKKWWPEGSQVGMVVDSGAGGFGAVRFRSINVIEPYISGIDYDVVRLGTQYDFATPGTRGSACSEFVLDLRFVDGLWNHTYGASSSAFAFDNTSRVRQCYIDAPIPSLDVSAYSWANSPGGGKITARGLPSTLNEGRTTAYFYNASGTLTQKQDYDGSIEFFGTTGIKFPAGEIFKDYDEGAFTPTIKGTSSAGSGTYSAQSGRYTKTGNRVFGDINLAWSAHTGTGDMRIAGLPFTPRSSIFASCSIGYAANIALTAGTIISATVRDDVGEIELREQTVGGGAGGLVALDTAGSIYLSFSYEAAP